MKQETKEPTNAAQEQEDQAYLSRLVFHKEDFGKMLTGYISSMRLVALLLIALTAGGVMAYVTLPRTLNPEIGIIMVTVRTTLPGATPEDIEQLITDPLEDELKSVKGIGTMTSTSRESSSSIVLEFDDGIDQITAMADVRDAVGTVGELPSDATTPIVEIVDFEDAPILRYAITSEASAAARNRTVAQLEKALEDISIIDRVELAGHATQEVQIVIDTKALNRLGVDLSTLQSLIVEAVQSLPAGAIDSSTSSFSLTIDRSSMTIDDLRQIRIIAGAQRYTLGEIATVMEAPVPGQSAAFVVTPKGGVQGAVTMDVYRTIGTKIADATKEVEQVMTEFFPEDDTRFSYIEVTNVDRDIDEQFNDLMRNLSMTVSLVFVVLLTFVGIRQASVAALAVPLVFLCAFIAMRATGISLNFLSFFSLLLSLGLLVDVTIVIISAMTAYFRSGKFTALEAGLLVWKDFFVTLNVTTLTTVWAFIPLLLATGIIGEYIKPIPIIVSSMLVASVLVGFLIILPLMIWLFDFSMPRRVKIFLSIVSVCGIAIILHGILASMGIRIIPVLWPILILAVLGAFYAASMIIARGVRLLMQRARKHMRCRGRSLTYDLQNGFVRVERIEELYKRLLRDTLAGPRRRRRMVAMVALFFVFAFGLVFAGFVPGEFFPGEDQEQIYVHIELPLGASAGQAQARAEEFVPELFIEENMIRVQTQIGYKISSEGMPITGDTNDILYTIDLTPTEDRTIDSRDIATQLRTHEALVKYPYGTVSVTEIGSGPPAGADVTIKLIGDDLTTLDQKASELVAYLKTQSGVANIRKAVLPGTAKIVFVPDAVRLREVGVTIGMIGQQLRAFGNGMILDEDVSFSDLSDKRDVVFRTSQETPEVAALEHVTVLADNGQQVPLSTLGAFVLKTNPTRINHEESRRTLSVEADVLEGYNANEINQIAGAFSDGDLALPQGYAWETGGANDENAESVTSIMQAMVVALILIFLTLVVQLNSYRKSFIVLLVIPPAISGVFFVFAILGWPLSFPSLIGVLALFGIVINNSIIIIDQINKNLAEGLDFEDAIVEGSASRLDPILMSSMTTIVGLLPITLSEPVWQGLGGAIIAGLTFSGTIMLFFIPVVFYMMFAGEQENKIAERV